MSFQIPKLRNPKLNFKKSEGLRTELQGYKHSRVPGIIHNVHETAGRNNKQIAPRTCCCLCLRNSYHTSK